MKYKNISRKTLSIPGVGVVEAGNEIETEKEIINENFTRVDMKSDKISNTKSVEEPKDNSQK
ncbi:MAG: hypothetical protein WA082_04445 [Candidatus Moraniibacteriota bacterium]